MVLRERSYDYKFRYCGHCNTTTDIKEANFFGRYAAGLQDRLSSSRLLRSVEASRAAPRCWSLNATDAGLEGWDRDSAPVVLHQRLVRSWLGWIPEIHLGLRAGLLGMQEPAWGALSGCVSARGVSLLLLEAT